MNLLRYLYRVFFLNVDQLISLTEILYREKIIQEKQGTFSSQKSGTMIIVKISRYLVSFFFSREIHG